METMLVSREQLTVKHLLAHNGLAGGVCPDLLAFVTVVAVVGPVLKLDSVRDRIRIRNKLCNIGGPAKSGEDRKGRSFVELGIFLVADLLAVVVENLDRLPEGELLCSSYGQYRARLIIQVPDKIRRAQGLIPSPSIPCCPDTVKVHFPGPTLSQAKEAKSSAKATRPQQSNAIAKIVRV